MSFASAHMAGMHHSAARRRLPPLAPAGRRWKAAHQLLRISQPLAAPPCLQWRSSSAMSRSSTLQSSRVR